MTSVGSPIFSAYSYKNSFWGFSTCFKRKTLKKLSVNLKNDFYFQYDDSTVFSLTRFNVIISDCILVLENAVIMLETYTDSKKGMLMLKNGVKTHMIQFLKAAFISQKSLNRSPKRFLGTASTFLRGCLEVFRDHFKETAWWKTIWILTAFCFSHRILKRRIRQRGREYTVCHQ